MSPETTDDSTTEAEPKPEPDPGPGTKVGRPRDVRGRNQTTEAEPKGGDGKPGPKADKVREKPLRGK